MNTIKQMVLAIADNQDRIYNLEKKVKQLEKWYKKRYSTKERLQKI